MLDLIIRNSVVIQPEEKKQQEKQVDVAVQNGKIVQIQENISDDSQTEIDATGLHLLPSMIDVHVHFNEPGRTAWEGISTGSAAFAAGGGTTFFDMPLNSSPPLLTKEDFEAKKQLMLEKSHTDFALWGGLTPTNIDKLPELATCGVIGFKAFMSNSGIDEFQSIDDANLYEGMQIAAELGLPVAVHAESDTLTAAFTKKIRDQGGSSIRDYLNSRPIVAELEAIQKAILYAEDTGAALHIVHISSSKGIELVTKAKQRGVNVTAETCAHYLWLTEESVENLGAVAKCAPPLRSVAERDSLIQSMLRSEIDIISSDHSPSDPELKERKDFFDVWGGIAGVQSSYNVVLSLANKYSLDLKQVAQMLASNPAKRFGLATKGEITEGFDADFVLVDLQEEFILNKQDLKTKYPLSPYVSETFQGAIQKTFVRGTEIFDSKTGLSKTGFKAQLIT